MLSQQDKKGLSEMVSYVLLIVIAVSLSFLVFSYLKVLIPKEKLECPDDVSLIISDYSCSSIEKSLTINILNKGLWKMDGFYLRADESGIAVKKYLLNDPGDNSNLPASYFFIKGSTAGLNPEESYTYTYINNLFSSSTDTYELELEPFIIKNDKRIFCSKAVSSQIITCK